MITVLKWIFPLYWPFGIYYWLFPPQPHTPRAHRDARAAVKRALPMVARYAVAESRQADEVEAEANRVEQLITQHPAAEDHYLRSLGDPQSLRQKARSLRELSHEHQALVARFQEDHLPHMCEPGYDEESAFQSDFQTLFAVAQIVLCTVGPFSVGLYMLLTFPIAAGIGRLMAYCLLAVRRALVAMKLGFIVRDIEKGRGYFGL